MKEKKDWCARWKQRKYIDSYNMEEKKMIDVYTVNPKKQRKYIDSYNTKEKNDWCAHCKQNKKNKKTKEQRK